MIPVLAFLAIAQEPIPLDLAAEAALEKSVTVEVKLTPINTALKVIGKQLDAPVESVTPLWDRKVTVYCKEVPAADIMASLASVLGAQWVKDDGIYRLRVTSDTARQERDYVAAEERQLKGVVESQFAQLAKLQRAGTPAPNREPADARAEDGAALLGKMIVSIGSAQMASIWRGEPTTFAPMIPGNQREAARTDESRRIAIYYNPFIAALFTNPNATGYGRQRGSVDLIPFQHPPKELATMPFAKTVMAWEGDGEDTDDPAFAKAFRLPAPPNVGSFVAPPTVSDQLEAMHRETGVNVVADAFRLRAPGGGRQTTPAQFLQDLRGNGFAKVSHGIFQARTGGFWRMRKFEIAEATMDPFAERAAREPLTLMDYGAFYGKLKPEQAAMFLATSDYVVGFDPAPLQRLAAVFPLLNSLSPAQRSVLGQGGTLEIRQLAAAQSKVAALAILQGVAQGDGGVNAISAIQTPDETVPIFKLSDERSGEKRSFNVTLGKASAAVEFSAVAAGAAHLEKK